MSGLKLRYFTEDEINFVSYGCEDGYDQMSIKVLLKYDELRHNLGSPLHPTCAFRTVDYDKTKGRSGKSDHCSGVGMDLHVLSLAHAIMIIVEASKIGFNSFGVNLKKNFVHIGIKDKLTTWDY